MRYAVQITQSMGKVDWAEKYLTQGIGAGTFTMWRLIGLLAAIMGALWTFGLISLVGRLLLWLLGGTANGLK